MQYPTPTVPEPSEAANSRLSSPDLTKDEASRFRGLVARVNFLSLDRPDLAVRGKDSESAHGSAKGVRLGQDQADRAVSRQSLPAVQTFAWQEKPTQISTSHFPSDSSSPFKMRGRYRALIQKSARLEVQTVDAEEA